MDSRAARVLMRDTCLRLCLAHATGAHHTFHTRLFRCFDCYDMVETHGYVIDYFRQKRNIMYDHASGFFSTACRSSDNARS